MSTYVICEVGQNHNGSMDLARQLIDETDMSIVDQMFERELPHADAVKFTKRDLDEELADSAMQMPYDSPHSFGDTYGEHRAALELSEEQHYELYQYAKEKDLDFVETLCSPGCLDMLRLFEPDRLKVASRDLTNLPLLDRMAETQIPIILSTGMAGPKELDAALEVITNYHDDITILHCLSQYPADYQSINLRTITFLKERYPKFTIGYSDHSIGIMVPVAAVALGAEVIEKHVTLDRSMKGSDHAGALAPEGVWRMMRDIRNAEMMLGEQDMFVSSAVEGAQVKLERSVASRRPIQKGESIEEDHLQLLSPGDGVQWSNRERIVGATAKEDIAENEIIYESMIEKCVNGDPR